MLRDEIFTSLGIPHEYGQDPYLPCYEEATELVEVEANSTGRMQYLTPDTAHTWKMMKQQAFHDGVVLKIVSGFRSIAHQTELIQNKLANGQSIESILKVNAAPGFSQHHTGMAIDLTTDHSRPLTEEFEITEAYTWLVENACRFNFIMPYDRNNKFGLAYEPWHWSQLQKT